MSDLQTSRLIWPGLSQVRTGFIVCDRTLPNPLEVKSLGCSGGSSYPPARVGRFPTKNTFSVRACLLMVFSALRLLCCFLDRPLAGVQVRCLLGRPGGRAYWPFVIFQFGTPQVLIPAFLPNLPNFTEISLKFQVKSHEKPLELSEKPLELSGRSVLFFSQHLVSGLTRTPHMAVLLLHGSFELQFIHSRQWLTSAGRLL